MGNDRGFPLIISTQLEIALIWEERLLFEVVIVARIVLKGSVGFGSGLGGEMVGREGLVVVRNGKLGLGEDGRLTSSGMLEGISELKIIGLDNVGELGRGERDGWCR